MNIKVNIEDDKIWVVFECPECKKEERILLKNLESRVMKKLEELKIICSDEEATA